MVLPQTLGLMVPLMAHKPLALITLKALNYTRTEHPPHPEDQQAPDTPNRVARVPLFLSFRQH